MNRFCLIIAVAMSPVGAFAQDTSDADKSYLAELLEDSLSGEGRTITINGFAGAFSSEATITQIAVSDADGVWLTLDDVALAWNRSALLRGRIEVAKLAASSVTLSRLPIAQSSAPSPEATPFALPDLPVSLQLDQLDIPRISLGEAVMGQALDFSLSGSAALASGALDAAINARRLDDVSGLFKIDLDYSNATSVLGLDLAIAEDPNGLAATLLDLPGRPSTGLRIKGNAPLDAFAADLEIATDGAPRIAGTFGLASLDDGTGFSLDIAGDVTSLFLREYQDFFGPDVSLRAAGASLATGGFQLNDLDLLAQSLQLGGTLTIDEGGMPAQFALSGRVASPEGDLVLLPLAGEKTYVDRADLNIAYDRAVSDDWTADINIAGLDRPGMLIRSMALSGGGVIQDATASAVTAKMNFNASGITLDDPDVATALGDDISGDIDVDWTTGEPARISRLSVIGAGLDVLADATISGADTGLETDFSVLLNADNLARFAPLAEQPIGGGANMVLLGQAAPLNGTFDAILTADTTDLTVGIEQLDPYLRGAGKLSLAAVRDTDGTRVESLRIATPLAEITGEAALTSAGSQAELAAALTTVAPALAGLNGPARLAAAVSQDETGAITFDVDTSLPDAAITARGEVRQSGDQRTIDFDAQANIADLASYNAVTGQQLSGGANLGLEGVLLSDGQRFDLNINGSTDNLQTGIERLDPLIRGDGTISGEVTRISANRFRLRNVAITTPAATVTADGTGGLQGAADLNAQILVNDSAVLDPALSGPIDLRLAANRDAQEQANVTLSGVAPGADLDLQAQIAPPAAGYAISGALEAAVADLGRYAALVGQPIAGRLSARVTGESLPDLSSFDLALDATTRDVSIGMPIADTLLRGAGAIALQATQAEAALSVPRLNVTFDNFNIAGALDGKNGAGNGTFTARLRDVGLLTDTLSGPLTAQGAASRAAASWSMNATADGPGGITARVNGSYADSGIADLRINGAAPLGLANDVLAPRRASGDIGFDVAVQGPPALSSVAGRISLTNGAVIDPGLGQALRDIAGNIRLANANAQVALSGRLDSGGEISLSGPVGLNAPYNGDVTARLSTITLTDPNLYETSVDGIITLTGPLAGGARVAGTLALGRTELQVPSSGIGALGDLPDVTHLGASAATRRTIARAGGFNSETGTARANAGPAYPLDLTINAPSQIFIRGRGLDAELGGALTLGGTTQNIIPLGQFSLVRGRLDILQQRFELTEGTATLQGDFVPFIRLVAATEADTGTLIEIIVEGPATAPEVTFVAQPALPQDEVLSQLIFGRNLSDISPLQAVQLAAAVGTLAGRGGGGLINTLRQDIGLDDFDVTTDADGNAALRAGKYLSENVYTDVTVNTEGDTNITINLDVTDNVTAKGTLGTDGETSIGIFYERDY